MEHLPWARSWGKRAGLGPCERHTRESPCAESELSLGIPGLGVLFAVYTELSFLEH